MTRREFITLLGGAAASAPQVTRVLIIGRARIKAASRWQRTVSL